MSVSPVTLPPSGYLNNPYAQGTPTQAELFFESKPTTPVPVIKSSSESNIRKLKPEKNPSTVSEPIMEMHSRKNSTFEEVIEVFIRERALSLTIHALRYLASFPFFPTPTAADQQNTIDDLYARYPHLEMMDLLRREMIDETLSPLKTQGAVDHDFITNMVGNQQMSEKEAAVAFHCRKWAQLNGFSVI